MDEYCADWEPVPPESNRYMELIAQYVAYATPRIAGSRVGYQLQMIATAPRPGGADEKRLLAWRIVFQNVEGFRLRNAEMWRGAKPRPNGRLEVAAWEIRNSHWLIDTVPAHVLSEAPFRHFVLASMFQFYDIAALDWKSTLIRELPKGGSRALYRDLKVMWNGTL